MASCDTPEEQAEAIAAGWRVFRTRLQSEALVGRRGSEYSPATPVGHSQCPCLKQPA
jgi:hypothetical protein